MSELETAAIGLLSTHGIAVLPTLKNEKHPTYTYSRFVGEDKGKVPALWKSKLAATGAFLCGDTLPPGYLVLDLDFVEDKWDEFFALVNLRREDVLKVKTPRGGLHAYLKTREPIQARVALSVQFEDGTVGHLDVRGAGIKNGIMLPGSSATNADTGEVAEYVADQAECEAILQLKWPEISPEAEAALSELVSAPVPSGGPCCSDNAADAWAKSLVPLLQTVLEGKEVPMTNEFAAWLGTNFGMSIQTLAPAHVLAAEGYQALLGHCTEEQATAFSRSRRHKKSFDNCAEKSIQISQQRLRVKLAEASNPVVSQVEGEFDKQVFGVFFGACGARVAPSGEVTFAVLPQDTLEVPRSRVQPDDWQHPKCKKVELPQGFQQRGGVSWLRHVVLQLKLRPIELEFEKFEAQLKYWLLDNAESDASSAEVIISKLRRGLAQFDDENWRVRLAALTPPQKAKSLWNLAPNDGDGRRKSPFIALDKNGERVIAVPSTAQLPAEALEVLGESIGFRSGASKGSKVYIYEVPEEIKSDA
jgi:bifunctional DNA primase/polymerase-like protein